MNGHLFIMAAGLSNRMGRPKALLPWPYKESRQCVLEAILRKALLLQVPITVVINNLPELADVCHKMTCSFVINEQPERGKGSSIKTAVSSIKGPQAMLFWPADQPFVETVTLRKLLGSVQSSSKRTITFPVVNGQVFSPTAFSSVFYDDLLFLDDAESARTVIGREDKKTPLICHDEREFMDLDTPQAYQEALTIYAGRKGSSEGAVLF